MLYRYFLNTFLILALFYALPVLAENDLPPLTISALVTEGGFMGSGCKEDCAWLVIYGTIDDATPGRFKEYFSQPTYPGIDINAQGEDIIPALELGKMLHQYGKPVSVNAPIQRAGQLADGTPTFGDSREGVCVGACLYAFVGYAERYSYLGSRYTLSPLKDMDSNKWKKLTDYVQEMGVSDRLIEAQREVQKSGKPRALTDQELKDWKILNMQ